MPELKEEPQKSENPGQLLYRELLHIA